MEWDQFVDWLLKAVLGGVTLHGVHILSETKKSIDSLNQNMARMNERSEWQSREMSRIETRLNRLESLS